MTSRRRFLQVSVAGAAALFAVEALERAFAAVAAVPYTMADEDARIVRALAPVVLEGALPSATADREAALQRIVDRFDRTLAALDAASREELSRLFGLLRFAPARLALTGVWRPLTEAPPVDIAAFLASWRASRFDLLRAGYAALTQLLQAAWYDDPAAWKRVGYPGPPELSAAPRQ